MQRTARTSAIPRVCKPVILIGATGVGKSTQAYLVAKALGVQQVSLDGMAAELYCQDELFREAFNATAASSEANDPVLSAFHTLASQLEGEFYEFEERLHKEAVSLALRRYRATPCIMDFGAGHTAFTSEVLRQEVHDALSQHRPVILLQPHSSLTNSARYLFERQHQSHRLTQMEIEYELRLARNHEFATHTVFTAMKSRETVTKEIVDVICSD